MHLHKIFYALITHRWVDINDVLANTLGFVIGYYLSKLIDK